MSIRDLPKTKFRLYAGTRASVRHLKPITSLSIFVPSKKEFDPDGLFSLEIFGQVASKDRVIKDSYIDLRTKVITPLVYDALVSTKYKNIMNSSRYYKWDEKLKDFMEVKADAEGAETGYHFFLSHINDLKPENTGSSSRKVLIRLLEFYKGKLLVEIAYVLPAGLRDYQEDESGRGKQDEINDLYRKILINTNMLPGEGTKTTKVHDKPVFSVQVAVYALYQHVSNILNGKYGYTKKRFAARSIHNTSQNVLIGQAETNIDNFFDNNILDIDGVKLPLIQAVKGILPKAIPMIKRHPLVTNLTEQPMGAMVVDRNSSLARPASTKEKLAITKWFGDYDAIGKTIDKYTNNSLRNKPITLGKDAFLYLVYDNPKDEEVYIVQDIDELPDDKDRKHVRPFTLTDLLLITTYEITNVSTSTRFPIETESNVNINVVKTKVTELDRTVTIKSKYSPEITITCFPRFKSSFINGIAVPSAAFAGLGADTDGDKMKTHILMTDEAVAQGKEILNDSTYWVTADGKLRFSCSNEVADGLMAFL